MSSSSPDAQAKNHLREKMWALLDAENIGRTGLVHGKIPNFHGADQAAQLLSQHPVWITAQVVKANPDKAQAEVRRAAVEASKLLYMAVPKIATEDPFYLIDPQKLSTAPEIASSGKLAAQHAPRTHPERMRPLDVIVCGSVAVNPNGVRIGKGAGYSDIEMALLAQAGLVTDATLIVTTVHSLQVTDEPIPESEHDVSVDLIVTPEEVIPCPPRRRPSGIHWESLTEDKVSAIPILQALREGGRRT